MGEQLNHPICGIFPVGTWLSLVEHSLGVRGVGSSNLPVPTNQSRSRNSAYTAISLKTADPRSTPRKNAAAQRMRQIKTAREPAQQVFGPSNLPVPTNQSRSRNSAYTAISLKTADPRSFFNDCELTLPLHSHASARMCNSQHSLPLL
jgi:hypothetical protein